MTNNFEKMKNFDAYLEKHSLNSDKKDFDNINKNNVFSNKKENYNSFNSDNKNDMEINKQNTNFNNYKYKTNIQKLNQSNNKNNNRKTNYKYNTNNIQNGNNFNKKEISKVQTYIERMTERNRKFIENFNPNKNAKVKIIPLGGLNAIGLNITLIEDDNDIIIIDCGNAFPSEDLLGVDLVIPDFTYLKKNQNKIRGLVITHGHEDHIGAIPYLLDELNIPIYGTKLTMALVDYKLKEHKNTNYKLNVVAFKDVIKLGNMYVEFIKTNHSIVDSAALAIYTKAGIIMHTGDFKVDYTPVVGDIIDLPHFAEIGQMGVLALLSDSTNAIKPGFTLSEKTIGKILDDLFNEHSKERIIVATFASNLDRVRQIIETASKYGRKVVIEGHSMINIINIAISLSYINIPKGTLINVDMVSKYSDSKMVIITTGSQGESMAALSRMAQGTNKKLNIKKDDVVILSSSPIPGNEKAVNRVIDELYRRQAKVIYHDTHVSGHACAEELKLIYTLVSPEYAIPIHGEYRHRKDAATLAESVGVKKDNCLLIENGDVLEICSNSAEINSHIPAMGKNVDGLGVGDVGNIVLRDRQALSSSGIVIIAMALSHSSSSILSGPDIISKGFIYMKESTELLDGIKEVVFNVLERYRKENVLDWKKLKAMIVDDVNKYLWKTIKREPLIIPIIISI